MDLNPRQRDLNIEVKEIPAERIDSVRDLWLELARHHWRCAPQMSALAQPVDEASSWATRQGQYAAWAAEPNWLMLGAVAGRRLVGYTASRVTPAASSWRFGPSVGRLETLVLAKEMRGYGTGQELFDRVRAHWNALGVRYGSVSVIAGNVGAEHFYQRLGAVDFTKTSYFPV